MIKNQNKKQLVFSKIVKFDPDSKISNVFFDENGKILEITLHKKDVSHIYGVRRLIGVEVENTPINNCYNSFFKKIYLLLTVI